MDFNLLLRAKPYVAQHLKKDFAAFCRAAWPHLHPGSKLSWTTAHDLICEHLVAVYRGNTRRLIINCPPRFAKSTIANICWPVWIWLQDPAKSFLCTSYEIDLALNMNLNRRRLMDSKWFRDLFGDVIQLSTDRAQAGDFSNTAGGQMQAASVNSKAQGRGGHYVVCDDPLSADFAYSESFRNETNAWFTNQLPQRLNNPSESAIVVIMQRLHQNDPAGFLLGQEETEWTLLKLPLICEQDETIRFPLSGRTWRRKKGDCLDPKRWSPRTVGERQRDRLTFASQFQQEPAPTEGNLIRADDILFFGGRNPQTGMMDPGLPESFERKIISVDCSFKDKAGADYVAIVVVGVVGSRRYLLHVTNSRLDLAGTENEIRNCHAANGPISAVLVEDAANGPSVINHLKEEISGVVAVRPEGGKMARVVATAPEFQAGNWVVDRTGVWTYKVVEQLTMFPNAKNDDICDAITQAAIWLQANSYSLGFIDYLKGVAAGSIRKPIPAATAARSQLVIASSRRFVETFVCPACKSPSTVRLGRPGNIHCNMCGANFDPQGNILTTRGTVAIGVDCCENPLRQVVANALRCGTCGRQSTEVEAVGVSRAWYESRRGFGRFRA